MNKIFNSMMAMAIAAFTFTACEDVPEPYNNPYDALKGNEPVVVDPAGSGTAEDPWNVTALVKACEGLAANDYLNEGNEVYVKGIVVETKDISTQYKNATYYIADDLNGEARFYVFRGKMLNGADVKSDTDLQVGDEVTICGKVKNYVDKDNVSTLEFDTGNYLVSLKKGNGESGSGDTPDVKTVGSKEAPKTVAEALAAINAMEDGATSEEFWFVKGKVVKVTTSQANFEKYGNLNYLISEDGTENNTITVYSGDGLNGDKFTGIDALKAGDEVIVYGHIQKYVNKSGAMTPEISTGNYLVSLNSNGGGNNSGGDKGSSVDNPYTIAEALAAINALADNGYSDAEVYVKGKVVKVTTNQTNFDKYGNLNYLISEDGTESNTITVYSGDGLNGEKFSGIDALTAGDEVIVYGKLQKYVKNDKVTPEIAKGNYLVSLKKASGNGGDDTPTTGATKISVANFIAAAESTEVWYQLTGTIKNLKAGDQYGNFDLEDETGSVYVYGVLSEKGGEKKKFQELVTAKGIENGKKITIIGNRGSYTNKTTNETKIEVTNAYFVSVE